MLSAYEDKDGLSQIVIRVREGQDRRDIPTGRKIAKKHWDEVRGKVKKSHTDAHVINGAVEIKLAEISKVRLASHIEGRPVKLKKLSEKPTTSSFSAYIRSRQVDYQDRKMDDRAEKVGWLLEDLAGCFGDDIFFDDVDTDWCRKFDAFNIQKGNKPNTRVKKFSILSGFYKAALKEGRTTGINPIDNYNIQGAPVKKVKLTVEHIQSLESVRLTGYQAIARDIFLFSFYARGARFENCLAMPPSAIANGRLSWRVNKGGGYISVPITPKIKAIIDRYLVPGAKYIFPVMDPAISEKDYKKEIINKNTLLNRHLRNAAKKAGIDFWISYHIARHTFAFLLKKKSNSIHIIKDALRHKDSQTTERYLKELDDEYLDGEISAVYEY